MAAWPRVHFSAGASVRTIATRPQLVIQTAAPTKVLIGEQVMLTISVSNPGTGMATGVVLQERIPPGLQHPAGSDLEYQVGNLKPGETRKLELPLVANRPGPTTNLLDRPRRRQPSRRKQARSGSARPEVGRGHGRAEAALSGTPGDLPVVGEQSRHRAGQAGRVDRQFAGRA